MNVIVLCALSSLEIAAFPGHGAPPKVIACRDSGQGALNVRSWSPDNRRPAFVSNSDME